MVHSTLAACMICTKVRFWSGTTSFEGHFFHASFTLPQSGFYSLNLEQQNAQHIGEPIDASFPCIRHVMRRQQCLCVVV